MKLYLLAATALVAAPLYAQTGSTGLSSWAYGGSRNLVSHGRVRRSVPGR